jgi:phosphoribosyl 1,2-cyclic phosphodiesterase
MKLTVFASGSTGNCALVQGGGRPILVDAGISAKRIRDSLARAGLTVEALDGIFITHEHTDHIKGLSVLLKKTPVPVYAPGTVAEVLCRTLPGVKPYIQPIQPEQTLHLGPLAVTAFPTPHDTPQSVGYRLEAPDGTLGFATDTGCVTPTMLSYLSGVDIALIEANHDVEMLRHGPYPADLQRRILSERGHLSNAECTWLAAVLAQRGTQHIVLGHLSRENNLPGLAEKTVLRGLEQTPAQIHVAPEWGFLEVECIPCCV